MFGLEFIAAGMLHFAPEKPSIQALPVVAAIECRAKVAPKINVVPSNSRVRYDFSKSKAQLNTVDVDTISPYGPNHNAVVSGLMSGAIQVKHQVEFMYETYEQLGQGCIYLRKVDVQVHIEPTVFIASEYPQGTCMHNAVLTHERKHVREDQLIVNKYTSMIGEALLSVVSSQSAGLGPYEKERMPFVQQNVQNSISKVVTKYNDLMNAERKARQQAIDSFEEYESIGKQCKNK